MASRDKREELEDNENYFPTGYERRLDETNEDYEERMEDYESFVDYGND